MKQVREYSPAARLVCAFSQILHTDEEYRKGVHWLETLRIRRVKTVQAGYNVRLSPIVCCKRVLTEFTELGTFYPGAVRYCEECA